MPPIEDLGLGAQKNADDYLDGPLGRRPPPPPPPVNFEWEIQRAFLTGGSAKLTSVLDQPETLSKPVMLIVNGAQDSTIAGQNTSLRSKLSRLGYAPEFFQNEISGGSDLPSERTKMFRRIGEFFNLNLYDYRVKVGPTKEIK